MKKIMTVIITIIMAATLLAGCGSETVLSGEHPEDYVKTMSYHDNFTVLQLTDIHWNNGSQLGNADYGCERYLRKVIAEAQNHAGKIDLIEITGDTFMLARKAAVRKFIGIMEDIAIPYAIVWGNHDREGKYNPNWISKQFLDAPHCLYTEVDNDDVHERSNYVINLTDSEGNVVWQIFNLDSGASYREGAKDIDLDYDYLRQNQFGWMAMEHDAAKTDPPGIVYYHIAQQDNQTAFDAIEDGADYYSRFFKHEGFGESDYSGTTKEIFLENNIKGVFAGHAHANDWTVTLPEGIVYGMGVKTGTELYYTEALAAEADGGFEYSEDFLVIGASLITLKNGSGDFELEHLYYNERDEGDFVMWVPYQ